MTRLNSPLEAFKIKGQEMYSTANMLDLTAQILEEVHGLSSRIERGVRIAHEDTGNLR